MINVLPYTRLRPVAPTNQKGRMVESTPVSSTIRGTIMPISGRDLYKLPEGDRSRVVYKIYSLQELRTATPGGAPSDRVIYDGETYIVYQSQKWPRVGSEPLHWKATLVKFQEDETYVAPVPPEETP